MASSSITPTEKLANILKEHAITPTEKLANILKEHENMKKVRRTIVAKQTQEKYTVSGKSMK
jgi:hypothetical protein